MTRIAESTLAAAQTAVAAVLFVAVACALIILGGVAVIGSATLSVPRAAGGTRS